MKTIGPLLRQYAVVVTVNLCSLSIGMSIGWSSPGLVKLRDARQTTLARPITEEEGSWIVSFSFLAAVVAVFAAAFLMDHIGRKLSVILAAVLKIVVGVVQTLATEVWVVMLTRALVGGLDAIDTCVIPAYASEVASKEIRGALGTIFNIFIALGVVVMLAIGPFCSYVTLNILYSSVTLAATLPLVFVPESPYFLYAKGRKDQTHNVLTLLRGSEALAKEEIKEYSLTNNCGRRVNRWQLFKDRTFLKSLAISLVFNIGGQLMGHNVILCYLQTILELTDTDVEPEVASIVIGCVSVVASVSTFFFMKKFGRKLILAVTMCIAAIGLICVLHPLPRCNYQLGTGMLYMFQIGLGLFFEMQENGFNTKGYVSYLPLFSMILFYFCTASGFSTISAIVTSELFDGPARATGMAAVNMVVAVVLFLQGQYFMALTSVVGFPTVFWMFSVDSVLTCLFVIFFVPETKGRTFGEIQKELGRKCDDVVSSEM